MTHLGNLRLGLGPWQLGVGVLRLGFRLYKLGFGVGSLGFEDFSLWRAWASGAKALIGQAWTNAAYPYWSACVRKGV